ncbi:cobalt-precorrin-6A reductase [Nodosilinea nodulosa]|uniref:cobalt-precorrin-6A reductase n=1 Tax=Nodosilinea nodulosa TaxID=416001 RepID=UPI0002EBF517|nr:cobalt-precorrin-6A reductase [Nodosilinea nodulosa]
MADRDVVLWVIGGTGEAVELAAVLAGEQIPCLVTVTTPTARQSYRESPWLKVLVGGLDPAALEAFLTAQGVGAVLDASHPFAAEISRGAIAATQALRIPYWRYERPSLDAPASQVVCRVAGLETVLTPDILQGERVLLTLGYRWLHYFIPWQTRATLFARILPSTVALSAALEAGFTPDRLIALRPPIYADLEKALWQQWRITRVITKASGAPGGEAVKRAVAEQLSTPLYILDRPKLDYPTVVHSQAAILALCRRWWKSGQPR